MGSSGIRSRRRRRLLLVGVGLVLLVALIAVWSWWSAGSKAALEARIAELEAQGEPMTLAAIDGELATHDDGWEVLSRARDDLNARGVALPDNVERLVLLRGLHPALSDAEREDIGRFVREAAPYLRSVGEALERPVIRLHRTGSATRVRALRPWASETVDLAATALALQWLAAPEARPGPGLSASAAVRLEIVRRLDGLAERIDVREGPRALHLAFDLEMMALQRLQHLVEADDVSLGDVEERVPSLLRPRGFPRLARVLRVHRADVVAQHRVIIGDLRKELADLGPAEPADWGSEPFHRRARQDAIEWIDDVAALLASEDMTWRERAPTLVTLARPRGEGSLLVRGGLTDRIRRRWVVSHVTAAHVEAARRLALVALRAQRWRDREGQWPADPASLDPEFSPDPDLSLDPFTDRSFRFEVLEGALLISSPGPSDAAVWGAGAAAKNAPRAHGLVWTLRERAPIEPR